MITRRHVLAAAALLFAGAAASRGIEAGPSPGEPILPLPKSADAAGERVVLGGGLFADRRLSRRGRTSCTSCHEITANGATARVRDIGDSGRPHRFNTPTIFNVRHSYQLNWEGRQRSLSVLIANSLVSSDLMGDTSGAGIERLRRDPAIAARFVRIYGRGPDRASVVNALTAYVQSLDTPDAPFDRWLRGDKSSISSEAERGYRIFRTLGCVACHQGTNVGANLRQRYGIFHPSATPAPPLLRVPSLRNVAVTPPYFHDGSAATLEQAVQTMARLQLDRRPPPGDVADIAEFLRSLTGKYQGRSLTRPAERPTAGATGE